MTAPTHTSKRREMVEAALKLFAGRGIRGTTIRDIAQEAGVTEGALYRHFDSKEQLAQALFAECAAMLHEALEAAVAGVSGASERLCSLVRGFFAFADGHAHAYEYVMARHHENVGALPPGQPLPKDVFTGVLAAGSASGELRPIDPDLGAAMVIGICLRTIFFLDRGLIRISREEAVSEVCGAVQRIFVS